MKSTDTEKTIELRRATKLKTYHNHYLPNVTIQDCYNPQNVVVIYRLIPNINILTKILFNA